MKKNKRFRVKNEGVSPIIGVIIAVAITIVLASIAYVWFSGLTSDVGDEVVEPLNVQPDINIERIKDELSLKIIIGRNINWDDYKVILNNTEVHTTPGKISFEGETIYFDYQGNALVKDTSYELDIIDLKANMVVYSQFIIARSYPPEGTGVYGYITSGHDGLPLFNVNVSMHSGGRIVNLTTTDPSGAYQILYEPGTYKIVCEPNRSFETKFGRQFKTQSFEITVAKFQLKRYDLALELLVPETANLKGHVYNNKTNEALKDVMVRIKGENFFQVNLATDLNGLFETSLPGMNLTVVVSHNGYSLYTDEITVIENETKTYDIYLVPIPTQTATITGFVYDQGSGAVLPDIKVFTMSEYLTNSTTTDENGSFLINVVPGDIVIFVNTVDYDYWEKVVILSESENYLQYIYLAEEKGN